MYVPNFICVYYPVYCTCVRKQVKKSFILVLLLSATLCMFMKVLI